MLFCGRKGKGNVNKMKKLEQKEVWGRGKREGVKIVDFQYFVVVDLAWIILVTLRNFGVLVLFIRRGWEVSFI